MTGRGDLGGQELGAREGELRRLTIMFSDVVGSTELSGRHDPETYRELMRGYRAACRDVIERRFDGHILQLKGDGTLSTFGYPVAHENDAERAVRAGLELVAAMHALSRQSGESLEVRVGVHHGPVYLDLEEEDIYGFAANVAARLHSIADPGSVVVSEEVHQLVGHRFEAEPGEPQQVKGVAEALPSYRVRGERPARVGQPGPTPLVEREAELERLRGVWARTVAAGAGAATSVLVHGEAGIGKSRLVAALIEELRPARLLELHGSPFHHEAGLHPVRTLIEARCGVDADTAPGERLERLAGELTALGLDRSTTLPLLAPVLGIEAGAGYDPAAAEGRKLEEHVRHAVVAYLVACTRGEPAVVVAEDLHWFDQATRTVLADLRAATPAGLLVVATSREPPASGWEPIALHPLTPAGCAAFLDAVADHLDERDRRVLATRSGGVPLYLEELVRAGTGRPNEWPHDVVPVPGSVPKALYEPLVARLYATPASLPVAAAAAAAGQASDRELLAATLALPPAELDAALQALVDARVLEADDGPVCRYTFRHELLREVAYELQPPSWRRKVHDRLCDVLARHQPVDWHVLASQFERAERYSEAAGAYRQTAEAARRRGALAEARTHLTRAIELVLQLPGDAGRDHREVGLRLRRGFLAMSAEGAASADASADFDRCVELAASDPSGHDMSRTLISVWAYDLSRGELARARRILVTLRGVLDGPGDAFRPQNTAGFGIVDWFAGRFSNALDELTAGVADLAETGGDKDMAAVWFVPNDATTAMHVHLALARFMAGDVTGARDGLVDAGDVAAGLEFPQGPWSAAYANWLGSWVWIEAGRLDLAGEAVAELRASSERHGFDNWALIGATQSAVIDGVAALRSGGAGAAELAAHAEACGSYIKLWRMLGLRILLPFYLTTTGVVLAAAGDVDGARRRYGESLDLAARTGMRFYDAETTRRQAHLAGDQDAVVDTLHSALDLARAQAARPFELRIALDLHRLLGEEAGPALARATHAFDGGGHTAEIEEARARVGTPG
jgi:class 3 adenylate cyclase